MEIIVFRGNNNDSCLVALIVITTNVVVALYEPITNGISIANP